MADKTQPLRWQLASRGVLRFTIASWLWRAGQVDTDAPACDFGFRANVGYREGVRRLIEAYTDEAGC